MSRLGDLVLDHLPLSGRFRGLGDRFVRVRVDESVAPVRVALADVHAEVARHPEHARAVAEEVVAREMRSLDGLRGTVEELRSAVADLRFDLDRLSPAVAAIEVRLDRLRRESDALPAAVPGGRTGDGHAPRELLDEIRREHDRVRARFGAISAYEERLRRLESGRPS